MEIKEHLTIALAQFNIEWESVDLNLGKIESMVSDSKIETDILVLPEAFNTGFSTQSKTLAEQPNGKTVQWMRTLSSKYNCAVCGSLFINDEDRYYNRFYWVEPDGKTHFYDKRHLFSMGGEDHLFSHGIKQLTIEYKGWKIFPQICYDLRFPVWSRNVNGYDLLINVANWPAARSEVWKTLLKARAIENQCYVVAVNRIGTDGNKIDHSGNSLVIDPKGIKIFKAHHREMIETVTLDYHQLHHFRNKFNTLKDGDSFNLKIQ
jgi:predicted amidohydrolase